MSHYRGTRRPVTQGTTVTGAGNRLLYPCPGCGAARYERCYTLRVLLDPETGERTGTWTDYKDNPCSRRPQKEVEEPLDTEAVTP